MQDYQAKMFISFLVEAAKVEGICMMAKELNDTPTNVKRLKEAKEKTETARKELLEAIGEGN